MALALHNNVFIKKQVVLEMIFSNTSLEVERCVCIFLQTFLAEFQKERKKEERKKNERKI
jgi:hypothetical protein